MKRGNGLFGSAEQTGSIGVVTVNCARLGYLHAGDERALFARLDTLLDYGKESLEIKREVIQHHMNNGLFPYTKRYLGTLRNHFSTARRKRHQRDDPQFHARRARSDDRLGPRVALRLLDHVRARIVEYQEETGHMLQPRGDAGRGHDVPLREGRPPPLSGHPAGGHAADAVLHELVAVGRWASPTIRSRRSNARTTCSANTRAARCCICT
nr:anaerobic ribonucleoside-triphosphate reductase [Burkholderia mallei]